MTTPIEDTSAADRTISLVVERLDKYGTEAAPLLPLDALVLAHRLGVMFEGKAVTWMDHLYWDMEDPWWKKAVEWENVKAAWREKAATGEEGADPLEAEKELSEEELAERSLAIAVTIEFLEMYGAGYRPLAHFEASALAAQLRVVFGWREFDALAVKYRCWADCHENNVHCKMLIDACKRGDFAHLSSEDAVEAQRMKAKMIAAEKEEEAEK